MHQVHNFQYPQNSGLLLLEKIIVSMLASSDDYHAEEL